MAFLELTNRLIKKISNFTLTFLYVCFERQIIRKHGNLSEFMYDFSRRSHVPGIPVVKFNVMTNIKIVVEVDIKFTSDGCVLFWN